MQLKSLKVFCDIVGRRSFSRAADENGISQSGASQMVHHLEDYLGVKLIDRSKRPFVPVCRGEHRGSQYRCAEEGSVVGRPGDLLDVEPDQGSET